MDGMILRYWLMRVTSIPLQKEPDFVISLSRASVNTYLLVRGKSIRIASDILFAPLALIVNVLTWLTKIVVAVISSIVLIVLLVVLIASLIIGNSWFYFTKQSLIDSFDKLDRSILINRHLRLERSLANIKQMRNSKFLYKMFFLGWLNRNFYHNISFLESELRKRAYPNISTIPSNLPVHNLDPNDRWQDDLAEYSQEEIIIMQ